jgi:hypothetical protein
MVWTATHGISEERCRLVDLVSVPDALCDLAEEEQDRAERLLGVRRRGSSHGDDRVECRGQGAMDGIEREGEG